MDGNCEPDSFTILHQLCQGNRKEAYKNFIRPLDVLLKVGTSLLREEDLLTEAFVIPRLISFSQAWRPIPVQNRCSKMERFCQEIQLREFM